MRLPFVFPNSAGWALRGEVRLPAPGVDRGTVIFCHGFKGFWDWGGFPYFLDATAARGFVAVGFSFSGCGVSAGDRVDEPERFAENTLSREVEDLRDMVDALHDGKLPPLGRRPGPLGVVGHSFGGGAAILFASRDPRVAAAVTWAAVSTGARFSREEVAEWRARGWTTVANARTGQELRMSTAFIDDLDANAEALDIVAAARRLGAPLLLIHGEADESVPISEGEAIAAAAAAGRAHLLRVPGAGHTFGVVHPFAGATPEFERVLSETLAWLDTHLSP